MVNTLEMKAAFPDVPIAKAILTDLYQLTMGQGYWKTGKLNEEAVFHLFFREHPFHGGFTLCCGVEDCVRYLLGFKFEDSDLDYLARLKGSDGKRCWNRNALQCCKIWKPAEESSRLFNQISQPKS